MTWDEYPITWKEWHITWEVSDNTETVLYTFPNVDWEASGDPCWHIFPIGSCICSLCEALMCDTYGIDCEKKENCLIRFWHKLLRE